MFNLDPSKLDPKLLAELTELVRQLPPQQLMKMQTLMHNSMAGFNVQKEMEEFEKSLPAGFREKVLRLMGGQVPPSVAPVAVEPAAVETASGEPVDMSLREARLTVFRAVAEGRLSPDEAEKLLFP